uniref:Transmembrane protein n=1 Tax=viral metagenome TaxID=1070528 RepID=A0A6C0JHI1_9ZZZZ
MQIAGLRNLCTPAYTYLVISIILLLVMIYQNYSFSNTYCLGSYSCTVSSTMMIFIIKILYVLFWTWILNLICRAGAPSFAWFLVLFPIILLFVLIAFLFTQ